MDQLKLNEIEQFESTYKENNTIFKVWWIYSFIGAISVFACFLVLLGYIPEGVKLMQV